MRRNSANRIAIAIIAGFVALAWVTSNSVPYFEASDEAAHFLAVHNLLEDRALDVIPTRDDIDAYAAAGDVVAQWSIESHQPPLYYAAGALLVSWTIRDDITDYLRPNELIFTRGLRDGNSNQWLHSPAPPSGDTHLAIAILRIFSLILSAGTLWLVYQAARLAFGSWAGLTALLLTASIPTFVTISGSINNDNLVTLLYTAGVWWCLWTWRNGLSNGAMVLISAILAAIALTKITGLSLFGVVAVALFVGAWRGWYSWQRAAWTFIAALGTTALIAGWWYLRNWSLYGDPLAFEATAALWGRTFADARESGDIVAEAWRIWRSFWLMVGHLHQPVWGPAWLYGYAVVITLIALVGWLAGTLKRSPALRPYSAGLLVLVGMVVTGMLVVGTRGVDISYGRLLFPALVAFVPLLVMGWYQLLGRMAAVLVLPLIVVALLAPFTIIPEGYPRLHPVAAVPEEAIPIGATVDGLEIVAYQPLTEAVAPGDVMHFDLYLRGTHPDNPALTATTLDPITLDARQTRIVYPGSAPTNAYAPDVIYRTTLSVPVGMTDDPTSPRWLRLQLGWLPILDDDPLPIETASGDIAPSIVLGGATLIDPRHAPTMPEIAASAAFGGAVALDGVDLSTVRVQSGDSIDLRLYWRSVRRLDSDWIVAVQLLDESGTLVTQADGDLPGYPTSAWIPGAITTDMRTLFVPRDAVAGAYRVWVGWYQQQGEQFVRLPATGDNTTNDLYPLPVTIIITE